MLISLILSALLMHKDSLRADFLFSLRFSTPKTTPPTPTPRISYAPLNSFHSSITFKALLSKSTVSSVFLYPLALNKPVTLLSFRCLLTQYDRISSIVLFKGIDKLRELTWLFRVTENKGILIVCVYFERRNSSIERAFQLFFFDFFKNKHAIL